MTFVLGSRIRQYFFKILRWEMGYCSWQMAGDQSVMTSVTARKRSTGNHITSVAMALPSI